MERQKIGEGDYGVGGVWTLIYLGGFTKCPSQVFRSDFLDNNLPTLFLEKKSLGGKA